MDVGELVKAADKLAWKEEGYDAKEASTFLHAYSSGNLLTVLSPRYEQWVIELHKEINQRLREAFASQPSCEHFW